jgi:hypothetical protein
MGTIKAVRVQGMSYPKVLRPDSSSSRLDFPSRAMDGLPNIGGPKEKMAINQIPDDPELVLGAVKPTSRFGTRPTKTDHAEGVAELAADPIIVPKPLSWRTSMTERSIHRNNQSSSLRQSLCKYQFEMLGNQEARGDSAEASIGSFRGTVCLDVS